ncbi:MAG: ribosome-associated translation inhibitor RaiA [Spirochaetes bacterium]|nr:ribosome-associated translation inhibitor RaiA [Spirochaetota bacterium]
MNLTVTGRHINVSDRFKEYVDKKIDKLEKYFHQVMEIKVIIFKEKVDDFVEILVFADGVQFHGIEKGGDHYSAFDLLLDKLELQVKKHKEKHQQHKGVPLGEMPVVDLGAQDDIYMKILEVSGKPINEIEAFLQMDMEKSDFILFKKGFSKMTPDSIAKGSDYAVIFRENGSIKMVEVPAEMKNITELPDSFEIHEVTLKGEGSASSITKKPAGAKIKSLTINEAVNALTECDKYYLPFFNRETKTFNVLSTKGQRMEVFIPSE